MTTAVVVPCRNEAAHITALLDALAGQTCVPAEVVIVDDRSTDGTAGVAAAWASNAPGMTVRVIPGPGKGPAAAVNTGIRSTQAAYLIRLDGHSRPAPDYVERCLQLIHRGIVGGRWVVRPGAQTTMARAIAALVSHPLGSGGAVYRRHSMASTQVRQVETVPFGAYHRSVWVELGGLDESLAVNEDFDFNFRARQAGYDVLLDPLMLVEYFARPTLTTLARQYARYGFWKFVMLLKAPRALHWRQLPPALVAPWILLTLCLAVGVPRPLTFWSAALYPMTAILGGGIIGATRQVNPLAAAVAMGTVHVCWSAGFWTAAIRAAWRRLAQI
ncbi:MAG: glycosyltransferase family 2 protein [Vicinamibacterales bacterium]